jgi:cytosine/adenosine deaminase-related metal-dependent hydrolase
VETDIPAMQPLRLGARQNVTSSLVYNATGSMVTHVFVGGRQLVKDKRLQGIDTRKITAMVRKASEKIAAGLDNFAG